MPKKIRIRTEIGVDKSVQVDLNQDFDFLEILSLQFTQQELYTRMCSDYGVIVGRVSVNNGYGLPNAKLSIFIPLSQEDQDDPIISTLYPYKSLSDRNEDGYKYNLLPYIPSYSNHTPTGTFPSRSDVLIDRSVIEVYDKYYKFTVSTNRSGDFMIFGVPVGSQSLVMNVDLSDIGEFSLTPQDLIRIGRASEEQVNGTKFKTSTNFEELPQIITIQKDVEVFPLWGERDLCQNAITRSDFDLTEESDLTIKPTAVFMGSIFSTLDTHAVKRKCRVKPKMGDLCQLQTGPGEIIALRHTINYDSAGLPILEVASDLEASGKVIDENGAWMTEIPMNLDYITTNEFGENVISIDPNVGIPTKGRYRFKIKWEQPQNLSDPVKRAYFLVPNVKEWGWSSASNDPVDPSSPNAALLNQKSYAFSLDWNDYGDNSPAGQQMIAEAILCKDRFYEFQYNKVYTVSQLIDQYRAGLASRRIISVKNILDDTCESQTNPFPTNDAVYRPDIIYLLFAFLMVLLIPIILIVVLVMHIIAKILELLLKVAKFIRDIACKKIAGVTISRRICNAMNDVIDSLEEALDAISGWSLPLITYPDCEICDCKVEQRDTSSPGDEEEVPDNSSNTVLSNTQDATSYNGCLPPTFSVDPNLVGTPAQSEANEFLQFFAGINPLDTNTFNSYCPENLSTNTTSGIPPSSNGNFSTSLTLSERLNLFNTKAKFYDSEESNNKGPNQMKVVFNSDLNGSNPNLNHYDNVLCMLADPQTLQTWLPGLIVSFQNPNNKKDPNTYSAATSGSPYQVTCITGTTINTGVNPITINFADPANPALTGSTTYQIYQDPDDSFLYTFPADIEYFQVITAMTISSYSGLCNPNYNVDLPNSLPSRFLFNTMLIRNLSNRYYQNPLDSTTYVGPGVVQNYFKYGQNLSVINPMSCLGDSAAQVVVFLVRGVDPYSTRVKVKYDLNRLFGFPDYENGVNFSSNIVIEGNYKLNIPIQPGLRLPRHDQINLNNSKDNQYFDIGGNPQGIFYPSYHFLPGSQFVPFTSNTVSFYSKLDETMMGYLSLNGQFYSGSSPYFLDFSNTVPLNGFDGASTSGLRVDFKSNFFVRNFDDSNIIFRSNYNGGSPTYKSTIPTTATPNTGDLWCWNYFPSSSTCNDASDPNMWVDYTFENQPNAVITQNRGYYVNESVEGGTMMVCIVIPGNINNPVPYNVPTSVAPDLYVGASSQPANRVSSTEFLDMSTYFSLTAGTPTYPKFNSRSPIQKMDYYYFSPGYDPFVFTTYTDPQLIIMRSDRLPTSDTTFRDGYLTNDSTPDTNNYFAFQQNSNFGVYTLDDNGVVSTLGSISSGGGPQDGSDTEETTSSAINLVITSLSNCEDSFPLECYESQGNTVVIRESCKQGSEDTWFNNGCYVIIQRPFISSYFSDKDGRPSDRKIILEWATRFKIIFAVCRNVFGHMFTNNWINGTLFAFSFKNDRFFTSPLSANPNQPYNLYCNDLIILQQPTNTFYYRSSPFKYSALSPINGEFIGLENQRRLLGVPFRRNANQTNLLNPTTILDLGPKAPYLQEITLNDDYDGYFADKLNPTTFSEVDDILNVFIITRLMNTKFIGLLRAAFDTGSSANILSYFSRVRRSVFFPNQKNMVDADYAQAIGINSQLGVAPFDPSNYPDAPVGDNPIYFNGGNTDDGVFGIFFSSDTQYRDYVSPRRRIIIPNAPIAPSGPQDFYSIKVLTQYVPFYDWFKKKSDGNDSIFGSQSNDWSTSPFYSTGGGTGFYTEKYQNMDRIQTTSSVSRYSGGIQVSHLFMTKDVSKNTYFKGYLYGEKTPDVYTAALADVYTTTNVPGSNNEIRYRTSGPYYFYFGLIKGSTAIDLFRTKYVQKDFNDE